MWFRVSLVLFLLAVPCLASAVAEPVENVFIFSSEERPTRRCHASTILATPDGLLASWFAGKHEKHPEVGIWISRKDHGSAWSKPVEVFNGIVKEGERYACWNPVLTLLSDGTVVLFYKVGPNPRAWWGMMAKSSDNGKTWGSPSRLPDGILGPIKNKPFHLSNGDLLCPTSKEDGGWRVLFESWNPITGEWTQTKPVSGMEQFEAIQPSILRYPDGRLQALCRSKQGFVTQTWSNDGGKSWTSLAATLLPNPNSGTDAVTLADGRQLLVYNNAKKGRSPLNIAVSQDGETWQHVMQLESEKGEYSYPAVIQANDGRIHITYTYNRQLIKHVSFHPDVFLVIEGKK